MISPEGIFVLQLSRFEGPLDLLLYLIEKNRFTLDDLEICPIIDQYQQYLASLQSLNIYMAGEFLEMSSYLIWVKSCLLLPQEHGTDGDEAESPVHELKEMLIAYRSIREAARELAVRPQLFRDRFPRGQADVEPGLTEMSLAGLLQAIDAINARTRHYVIRKAEARLNIREVMARIHDLLLTRGRIELRDAVRDGSRSELIAAFVAALELSKGSFARLAQQGLFSRIFIIRRVADLKEQRHETL